MRRARAAGPRAASLDRRVQPAAGRGLGRAGTRLPGDQRPVAGGGVDRDGRELPVAVRVASPRRRRGPYSLTFGLVREPVRAGPDNAATESRMTDVTRAHVQDRRL